MLQYIYSWFVKKPSRKDVIIKSLGYTPFNDIITQYDYYLHGTVEYFSTGDHFSVLSTGCIISSFCNEVKMWNGTWHNLFSVNKIITGIIALSNELIIIYINTNVCEVYLQGRCIHEIAGVAASKRFILLNDGRLLYTVSYTINILNLVTQSIDVALNMDFTIYDIKEYLPGKIVISQCRKLHLWDLHSSEFKSMDILFKISKIIVLPNERIAMECSNPGLHIVDLKTMQLIQSETSGLTVFGSITHLYDDIIAYNYDKYIRIETKGDMIYIPINNCNISNIFRLPDNRLLILSYCGFEIWTLGSSQCDISIKSEGYISCVNLLITGHIFIGQSTYLGTMTKILK